MFCQKMIKMLFVLFKLCKEMNFLILDSDAFWSSEFLKLSAVSTAITNMVNWFNCIILGV